MLYPERPRLTANQWMLMQSAANPYAAIETSTTGPSMRTGMLSLKAAITNAMMIPVAAKRAIRMGSLRPTVRIKIVPAISAIALASVSGIRTKKPKYAGSTRAAGNSDPSDPRRAVVPGRKKHP
jgi:hypothetical protein